MARRKFSEAKILEILEEKDAGRPQCDGLRRHVVNKATSIRERGNYGDGYQSASAADRHLLQNLQLMTADETKSIFLWEEIKREVERLGRTRGVDEVAVKRTLALALANYIPSKPVPTTMRRRKDRTVAQLTAALDGFLRLYLELYGTQYGIFVLRRFEIAPPKLLTSVASIRELIDSDPLLQVGPTRRGRPSVRSVRSFAERQLAALRVPKEDRAQLLLLCLLTGSHKRQERLELPRPKMVEPAVLLPVSVRETSK